MEFILTPHTKNILRGRKMFTDRLLCAAPNCLCHVKDQPDPEFGREIEVKGYAICPRCGAKTVWEDGKEEDHAHRKTIMRCRVCKRIIPIKLVKWTQKVISRHRGKIHEYFHGECWDAKFIDVPDDGEVDHAIDALNVSRNTIIEVSDDDETEEV